MWKIIKYFILGPVTGIGLIADIINLQENWEAVVGILPIWITNDWVRFVLGLVFLFILGWIYWPYIKTRFNKNDPITKEKRPYICWLKEAEKLGADFLDESLQILEFAKEVRQSASDEKIVLYGRKQKYSSDNLNRSEPLLKIPIDHWQEHQIDAISSVICGPPQGNIKRIEEDNFNVKSYIMGLGTIGFSDIHIEANKEWLENVTRKISKP